MGTTSIIFLFPFRYTFFVKYVLKVCNSVNDSSSIYIPRSSACRTTFPTISCASRKGTLRSTR